MTAAESVSSPLSTGGAGQFFEQHVGSMFLGLLTVRGIPPVLMDSRISEVHLQAEYQGWHTDDLVVVATRADGVRRLAAQVKRQFTVSSVDEECKKAFLDFWQDFKHSPHFDRERDRLALITLRGTSTLLDTFSGLLDAARSASDAADFQGRRSYLSKKAIHQADIIREIIKQAEGTPPADDDFYRFLGTIHVLSYDLNTSSGQAEAWTKTMLAQAHAGSDAVGAATDTWRELLELVGANMQRAGRYTYDDLPETVRARHKPLDANDGRSLQALAEHSQITVQGIRTAIADTARIPRQELATRLLGLLDSVQVAIVAGPAGCGKSALARDVLAVLTNDQLCLAFRAEEFKTGHIDQTLHNAQAGINAKRLLALMAVHPRKLLLIDSVERLLEASVRDAFSDLLRLAHEDASTRIILTCRDYSLETVRASLLEHSQLTHAVLDVPALTDDELRLISDALPSLRVPIANPLLKRLLRSPYLLDKAARMEWPVGGVLPDTERAFREKCWTDVVRAESHALAGMPGRREQVFTELALRRARALSPFVPVEGLDQEVVDRLRRDNVVTVSSESNRIAAPAHDVLEDWALVRWLGHQFATSEGDPSRVEQCVAGHPALRRAYRGWLSEMLECDSQRADDFVLSALVDGRLPAYFSDDTLVCTLLAPSAPDFVARQTPRLLADDGRVLLRAIHLLRVACKKPPTWLAAHRSFNSQSFEPDGSAWPALLRIVADNLGVVLPSSLGLVLGLVEDWSRTVRWAEPSPPGFEDAGRVAFGVLNQIPPYRMEDTLNRALSTILRIPAASPTAFRDLVQRGCLGSRDDHHACRFAEIALTGVEGFFACRDFPEEMVSLARSHFCLTDADLEDDDAYQTVGVEPFFGIRDHTNLHMFPASALRGPFLPLLRAHPKRGVEFIVDIANHAATWYGERRHPGFRLEPASQVQIQVPSLGTKVQWANSRFWCAYRGASVTPYVLECALMALETWLLEMCDSSGHEVERWLLLLLKESNNVALTAVVASICNAHPNRAGAAALALLSCRDLVDLDRGRIVQDHGTTLVADFFPSLDARNRIYNAERKKSDELPHRKRDLEALALNLQLGSQREEVWKVLDSHLAAIPPPETQSYKDKVWRLALHRMDLRKYCQVETTPASTGDSSPGAGATPENGHVLLGLGELDEDLQAFVAHDEPERAQFSEDMRLLNWGASEWDREARTTARHDSWKEMLRLARDRGSKPEADCVCRSGPGLIAAVCARDHWDELEDADRSWCLNTLLAELERYANTDDETIRSSRSVSSPDRAAAFVLSKLLAETDPESPDGRLQLGVAMSLTHAVEQVVMSGAEGVGYYLRGPWQPFAMRCAAALAKKLRLFEALWTENRRRPYDDQMGWDDLLRSVDPDVRRDINSGLIDADAELRQLDLKAPLDRETTGALLQILGHVHDAAASAAFHRRVAETVLHHWNKDRDTERRDFHLEMDFVRRLSRFCLRTTVANALAVAEPILEAVATHADEAADFVRSLILDQDQSEKETPFWTLWEAIAEKVLAAPWLTTLDSDYVRGEKLVRAMLLDVEWKKGARHWHCLDGHAHLVHEFVKHLPKSGIVLSAYCRFLYHIGEQSLPDAFETVAELQNGRAPDDLAEASHATFYLETLLGRYVYGRPLQLKSKPILRSSVLAILDTLVAAGSSSAFRMRDDFVTPLPPGAGASG